MPNVQLCFTVFAFEFALPSATTAKNFSMTSKLTKLCENTNLKKAEVPFILHSQKPYDDYLQLVADFFALLQNFEQENQLSGHGHIVIVVFLQILIPPSTIFQRSVWAFDFRS